MSIEFKLLEFNSRRVHRGAEGARVEICENGHSTWLWMSLRDIELNIKSFGPHPELLKAKKFYGKSHDR